MRSRQILSSIESSGNEGDNTYPALVERLERAAEMTDEVLAEDASATASSATSLSAVAPEVHLATTLPTEDNKLAAFPEKGTVALEVVADSISPAKALKHVPIARSAAPAADSSTSSAAEVEKSSTVADSSIRVDVSLLDKLMNLVGELVLARNQILQFTNQREYAALNSTSQRLNIITSELQEGVMKTRMQPIGMIWNKLPRVVRGVAHSLGKQVEVEMEGAETELDKTIIEAIKDPLTHLVRNSCDHGIEKPDARVRNGKHPHGTLRLKAYHEGGQVNIEISDDGSGIDVERVKRKAIEKGLIRSEQATGMGEREAIGLLFLPRLLNSADHYQCVWPWCWNGCSQIQYRKDWRRCGYFYQTRPRYHCQTQNSAYFSYYSWPIGDHIRSPLCDSASQPTGTDPPGG